MRAQLTYANVVATLALFLALGGSSYAVTQLTGKNIKDSSLTTKDVKNRSLLKRDFKLGQLPAGSQGLKGDKGDKGEPGVNGADGVDGAPGSALAYAHVLSDGSLSGSSETKNIDRSTQAGAPTTPATGVYCLHTTVERHNVTATLYPYTATGEIAVGYFLNNIHCDGAGDGGFNIQVDTYDSSGAPADRAFMIAIN
jgi:hypothetical protein